MGEWIKIMSKKNGNIWINEINKKGEVTNKITKGERKKQW